MRLNYRVMVCVVLAFTLLATSAFASAIPFSSDVEAINKAAQSVLMLEVYDSNDVMIKGGSGFVVFDNFTIVTNEHVIEGAEYIIGISDAGNQYMITKVITADAKRDIAILEFFSPTDLSPLILKGQEEVQRAEPVVAIGSPLGMKNSVSLGNISATFEEEGASFIQFTAPISPGSSGGALLDNDGQVIGITSASLTEGQNINLAVNIDEVIDLYKANSTSSRQKLSGYAKLDSAPIETSTPKPTVKPTLKPIPKPTAKPVSTPESLEGDLSFYRSKNFDGSAFKTYKGYEYNKFDKQWNYRSTTILDKSISIYTVIIGTTFPYPLPMILIYNRDEIRGGAFVDTIDILVGNAIYTYQNLRYRDDSPTFVQLYLGSIGKQMIQVMAKEKTISVRLTFRDNTQATYDLKSQAFASLGTWCKNIIKHKVFDLYEPSDLIYADKVHNATVH